MSNSLPKDIVKFFNEFVISNYKVFNESRTVEVYDAQGYNYTKYVADFVIEFDDETSTAMIRSVYVFDNFNGILLNVHHPDRGDASEKISFYLGKEFEDKVTEDIKKAHADGVWGI